MRQVLEFSPNAKSLWHLVVAEWCSMFGQVDKEKQRYRAAIDAYPAESCSLKQVIRTRLTLARLLLAGSAQELAEGQRALQEIESDLGKGGEGTTANEAQLCALQGYAAQRNGDYLTAVTLYKKSHAKFQLAYWPISKDHIEALQLLSWLLQDLGKTEEAEYFGRRVASLRRIYMGRMFEVRYRYP